MKKRYTEEKIISILKEPESGVRIDDLCRQYNIGYSTLLSMHKKPSEQ